MASSLPEVDTGEVGAFWRRYLDAAGEPGLTCSDVTYFGDSVELADELIELVLRRPKRAMAGSVAEYEAGGTTIPAAGDRWIACDGRGTSRAVLRTTEIRIGPLSSVDAQFAWDDGEGDRTRDDWLRGHTAHFSPSHAGLGLPFGPDIPVVFERFEVVYQEPVSETG